MSAQSPYETELGRYIPQPSFLDRLADKLELAANARTVFGEPIERDGATVVPVAKTRFGMGGGTGAREISPDNPAHKAGTGGGGGASVTPIGYIELARGGTTFRPIRDPAYTPWLLALGGLFGLSTLRAIGQIRIARAALPKARRRLRLRRIRRLFR